MRFHYRHCFIVGFLADYCGNTAFDFNDFFLRTVFVAVEPSEFLWHAAVEDNSRNISCS